MSVEEPTFDSRDVCKYLDDMTSSLSSVREVVQSLKSKSSEYSSNKDGISLLSLKHHVLLSYLQSLILVSSRRALGHSLSERTPPPQPFSNSQRGARGDSCGDLVDRMIEGRIVLEKAKALEGRMRYQIEKLVKAAQKSEKEDAGAVINDPLAFRPNPQNLVDANDEDDAGDSSDDDGDRDTKSNEDGIYRPPRVAPMPYVPQSSKSKRQSRAPVPTSLATLLHADGSVPHAESTSGLGNTPSLNMVSSRAKYLKRLTEFEEEQFGRVMMGKKEARRRRRDEEDLALGGGLTGIGEEGKGSRRRRTAGGLEDEFGDVLKDIGRGSSRGGIGGDGYEELRRKGKRAGVLERSRDPQKKRAADTLGEADRVAAKARKRSRFELERKGIKKRKN